MEWNPKPNASTATVCVKGCLLALLVQAITTPLGCIAGNPVVSPSLDAQQETEQEVTASGQASVEQTTTNITVQGAGGVVIVVLLVVCVGVWLKKRSYTNALDRVLCAVEKHATTEEVKRDVKLAGRAVDVAGGQICDGVEVIIRRRLKRL